MSSNPVSAASSGRKRSLLAEAEAERQKAHATQVEESDRYDTLEYPKEGYRDGGGRGKTKRRYGKTKRTRKTR